MRAPASAASVLAAALAASESKGLLKEAVEATLKVRATHEGVVDHVRFGEQGWKERYYAGKFKQRDDDDQLRTPSQAATNVVRGGCWVARSGTGGTSGHACSRPGEVGGRTVSGRQNL